MANKYQVIDLHRQNPSLSSVEIACRLDCCDAYVRATFRRNGLKLRHAPTPTRSGWPAFGAGLTLRELDEIAQRRSF